MNVQHHDTKNYGSGIITVLTPSRQPKVSGHPVVDIGDKDYAINKTTGDVDRNQLNRDLANKQLEYVNAEARGDQQKMQRLATEGADLRKAGATVEVSPEARALQAYYQRPEIKQAMQTRSTDDLNKAILQAKNDYIWAKNNNDPAGMTAASQAAAHLRSLGGTIPLNASFDQAKNIVYPRPPVSGHPVVDYGGSTLPVNKGTLDIDVELLNREVEKRKIEYLNAQIRGDQTAMQRASKEAADLRTAGATLTSDQDTEVTKMMKLLYQQAPIKNGISSGTEADLNQAAYAADLYYLRSASLGDHAHMQAASQVYITLKMLGATKPHGSGGELNLDPTTVNILRTMPLSGNATSTMEAITGRDSFTHLPLPTTERLLAVAGIAIGGAAKVVFKGVADKIDEMLVKISNGDNIIPAGAGSSSGNVPVGDSSPLAPGGGLKAHEGNGKGHLLERHVPDENIGLSDEALLKRLENDPRINASSAFTDRATAERIANDVLSNPSNKKEIEDWLSDVTLRGNLTFTYRGSQNVTIGRGVSRGANEVEDLHSAILVLKKDESGYFILTGYPTK